MANEKDGQQQKASYEPVPVALLTDTGLTESELVFYVLLVRRSHQKGYCFETNKHIGDIRGKNWRTVQRVIESLKKKGYIGVSFVDHVDEQGRQYKQRRVIPLRYVKNDVGGTSEMTWLYVKNDVGGTSEMTGIPTSKMTGNEEYNKRINNICANAPLHTPVPSHSESAKTKAAGPSKEEMFNEFWEAWPNKKNKKKAYLAFCRIKNLKAVFPVMMKALARQKDSRQWQEDGGKYIPLPTTWINGERWNDEIEEQPPASASSPASPWDSANDETEEERQARVAAAIAQVQALQSDN